MTQLAFVLRVRYGKTTMSKKLYFNRLSQKNNETIYEYADWVQKAAVGTQRSVEDIIHKFISGLHNQQLAVQLQMLNYASIPEVLT